MKGFFQLQRRFFSHWLWVGESRSFSKAEAFLDLLQLAAFTRTKKVVGGSLLQLEPGEVCGSERYLSGRWGWSTKKVRAFLTLLEADKMVGRSRKQGVTIITLCNYAKYTFEGRGEEAAKNHSGSSEEALRKQIEEGEELKKEKKAPLPEPPASLASPQFSQVWSKWIKHRSEIRKPLKATAAELQLSQLEKMGEARAIAAILHSISKGWQGIFEDKDAPAVKPQPWKGQL